MDQLISELDQKNPLPVALLSLFSKLYIFYAFYQGFECPAFSMVTKGALSSFMDVAKFFYIH